jgi:hypothetical protein
MSIPQILAAYQDKPQDGGSRDIAEFKSDATRDIAEFAKSGERDIAEFAERGKGTFSKMAMDSAEAHKKKPPITSTLAYLLKGIEERSQAKYHWKDGKPPESWVMGTFGRDLLRYEGNILRSHRTAVEKLDDVQRLEQLAVAGKDWGVARKLKADIRELKETIQTQKINIRSPRRRSSSSSTG